MAATLADAAEVMAGFVRDTKRRRPPFRRPLFTLAHGARRARVVTRSSLLGARRSRRLAAGGVVNNSGGFPMIGEGPHHPGIPPYPPPPGMGAVVQITGARFADVNLEHAIAQRAALADQADFRYQRH